MKRVLIVGAPGAGKGTQAENITKTYHIPHISTGDMFRAALKNETALGKLAKTYMDKGELVPDEVTIALVKERFMQPDCQNGFLLDGFPRNLEQAKALDEMLKTLNSEIDFVIDIQVNKAELINRIIGRRVCLNCGATYHITNKKPQKDGICDVCNHQLIQRKDDTLETVNNRLMVYEKQTMPILDYYQKKLSVIDGMQDLHDVFLEIKKILGE